MHTSSDSGCPSQERSNDGNASNIPTEADIDGELAAFTCFPKLPTELRLKVWKEACLQRRIIDVWPNPITLIHLSETYRGCPLYYTSHSVVPAVLHASKEARTVGLRHYTLDFSYDEKAQEGPATISIHAPPQIYVNWGCDIICPMFQALDSGGWAEAVFLSHMVYAKENMFRIALDTRMTGHLDDLLESKSLKEIILYHAPNELWCWKSQRRTLFKLEPSSLDSDVVLQEQESLFEAEKKARLFIDCKRQEADGSIGDCFFPNIKLMGIRVLEGQFY